MGWLVLVSFVITSPVGGWITLADKPASSMEVTLVKSDMSEVVLEVEVTGLKYEYVDTKAGRFTRLYGGTGVTGTIGRPELPLIRKLVSIPEAADVKVKLLNMEVGEYSLEELGLKYPIYPVQPPVPKLPGAEENMPFEYDVKAYTSNKYFPDKVCELGEIGAIRGVRYVRLDITPVQYNPAKNTLKIVKKVTIKLIFTGADLNYTKVRRERYVSPYFDAILKKMIVNYEPIKGVPRLPVGYLIIVYDDFYDNIQPLVEWKKKKGFHVTVTKTSDIPGGATVGNITNYIQDAYENWDIPPTFCLLVGDVGQIPAHTGDETGHVTDLYYFTVDGEDFIPDIFYGRFSGSTDEHIDAMVDKLVEYERNLWTQGTEWLGRMYFMTSDDGGHHHEVEYICNVCMAIAREHGVICDSLYWYYHSGTPIATAINEGRTLALYTGHGSTTGWAGPPFSQSDVNALENLDKYPFVVGHACLTGNFSYPECFAETWTRAEDKGAVAYFGSAPPSSYWVWDDTLQIGWFRPLFIEPTTTFIGGATQLGLYNVYEWGGNGWTTVQYYYEAYHIFGDPSMDLYTLEPTEFAVSYPDILPLGASSFTINVDTDSALVALYMDGILYGVAYSSGGQAVVELNPPPTQQGYMHITITKHNYATYEDSILVVLPGNIEVEPDTIPVAQTTEVTVTVTDTAGAPLQDVWVRINGWGVSVEGYTDSDGQVALSIFPPYGEPLVLKGRRPGEPFDVFTDTIWVIGAASFTADCEVEVPEIGLTGSLTAYYAGDITITTSIYGFFTYARGVGIDTLVYYPGDEGVLTVTPTSYGTLRLAVADTGYEVITYEIPVIKVYGTIEGSVTDTAGNPIPEVVIRGYPHGCDTGLVDPVFTLISDDDGNFMLADSVAVDWYDIYIHHFGYNPFFDSIFVAYGDNYYTFELTPSLWGTVYGRIYEEGTGSSLAATISIYRVDNNELYTQTNSDPVTGNYSVSLPYFTYRFRVFAPQHIPVVREVTVSSDSINEDFKLSPTMGNILIVNDDNGTRGAKLKDGFSKYEFTYDDPSKAGESAQEMEAILVAEGFNVERVNSNATNPDDWWNYDLIIWSDGDDHDPLESSRYRDWLIDYVQAGGKLLIEGGEVGFDFRDDTEFARNVLHIVDWETDNAGPLVLEPGMEDHPIVSTPYSVPSTISLDYDDFGDEDALIPTEDAYLVYHTTNYTNCAGILVYDNNPVPQSAQIVFYALNFVSISDSITRHNLLANTVYYLLTEEPPPPSLIYGIASTRDDGREGIKVTLIPGGCTITDTSGRFAFPVYPGTYTLCAAKEGYATVRVDTQVGEYDTVFVELTLAPYHTLYEFDFETSDGGFMSHGILWEWGTPVVGPSVAHSGDKLWGTDLDDEYSNNANAWLRSPEIDLSGFSKNGDTVIALEFWQWYDIESGFDGGNVKISTDGGTSWRILDTEPYYTGTASYGNAGIPNEPCFTGTDTTWHRVICDLTPYAGDTVIIKFHFGSDFSIAKAGWYIDDVAIKYAILTGVEETTPAITRFNLHVTNPVVDRIRLQYELPTKECVSITLYNVLGQQVGSLLHKLYEPGRYEYEVPIELPAGVYFLRFKAGEYEAMHKLIVIR